MTPVSTSPAPPVAFEDDYHVIVARHFDCFMQPLFGRAVLAEQSVEFTDMRSDHSVGGEHGQQGGPLCDTVQGIRIEQQRGLAVFQQ